MDDEELPERPVRVDEPRGDGDDNPDVGDGGGLDPDTGWGSGLRQPVPDVGGGAGRRRWSSASEVGAFVLDTGAKVAAIGIWNVIFTIILGFFGCHLDD